jgi:hypothetical protein
VVEHNPKEFRSRLRLYNNTTNLEQDWVIVGGVSTGGDEVEELELWEVKAQTDFLGGGEREVSHVSM